MCVFFSSVGLRRRRRRGCVVLFVQFFDLTVRECFQFRAISVQCVRTAGVSKAWVSFQVISMICHWISEEKQMTFALASGVDSNKIQFLNLKPIFFFIKFKFTVYFFVA